MSDFDRTYRLDRLYFKFMKPKDIPLIYLDKFAMALHEDGFINIRPNHRYSDTDKMVSGNHRKALFKLIEKFKKGVSHETILP